MTPKSVGVVTATVYVTTDSRKFDDLKSAEAHQLGLNRRKAICDRVKTLVPAGRPDTQGRIDDLTTFLYHYIEELQDLTDRMRDSGLLKDRGWKQDQ